MPLVVWAYPRGSAVDAKGGQNSLLRDRLRRPDGDGEGADVVKLNLPKIDPEKDKDAPAPYNELEISQEEAVRQVVASAGRSLVVLSGGSKIDDDQLLEQTRFIMEAGGSGVIYGRNVWQRAPLARRSRSSSRSRRSCSRASAASRSADSGRDEQRNPPRPLPRPQPGRRRGNGFRGRERAHGQVRGRASARRFRRHELGSRVLWLAGRGRDRRAADGAGQRRGRRDRASRTSTASARSASNSDTIGHDRRGLPCC